MKTNHVTKLFAAVITVMSSSIQADTITFITPVQLDNLDPEITRGRIECMVRVHYRGASAGDPGGNMIQTANAFSEFDIAGTRYNGQITNVVQIAPPQQWVDNGYRISVNESASGYECFLKLKKASSGWQPLYREDVGGSRYYNGPSWAMRGAIVRGPVRVVR